MTERIITISTMYEASRILAKEGLEAFNLFCDAKRIGQNDRDAILAKVFYDFKLVGRETNDGRPYFDLYQKEREASKWVMICSGREAAYKCKHPGAGDFNVTEIGG